MNKTAFKPGEGAKPTTELEYKALMAVMQADGWEMYQGHSGWPKEGLTLCISWNGYILWRSGDGVEIPLQEALFRGAPDWATILASNGSLFAWLSSNVEGEPGKVKYINNFDTGADGYFDALHDWNNRTVIATRPQPAAEPVWPEPGSLPPVGCEFEFSANGIVWEERIMLFNDGITCLMAHKKHPANRWHYKCSDDEIRCRPIQTERDRLIEQLAGELGELCPEPEVVNAVVDAGWRPTK